MSIITVVGAGMMGSAMSFPARDNGHEVRLVGIHNRENIESIRRNGYHPTLKRTLPEGVKAYHLDQLEEAMKDADLILCGVSSFGMEWFEENIVPIVPEGIPVLSITKGLEKDAAGNLTPFPEAIMRRAAERGQKICFNAVGGPVTSYELADRQQTHICFCGEDAEILKKLKSMFSTSYYHISLTTDVAGLETAVAMKNAYALAVSLTIGLCEKNEGEGTLHYNSQAAAFTEAVWEMRHLLRLFCGNDQQLDFGAGDLYVTIFGGRTRKLGILLGRGFSMDAALEKLNGVTLESVVITKRMSRAISRLSETGKARKSDYPLLFHVYEVLEGGEKADLPWKCFERDQ